MKKTKLEKLTAIKKNLENRITKLNSESFRIQAILFENAPFFNSIENVLNKGWTIDEQEKKYWLDLLFDAKDAGDDALILLKAEFKFNHSFKKQTGAFQNV